MWNSEKLTDLSCFWLFFIRPSTVLRCLWLYWTQVVPKLMWEIFRLLSSLLVNILAIMMQVIILKYYVIMKVFNSTWSNPHLSLSCCFSFFYVAKSEMSALGALGNSMAAQTTCGFNTESSTLCSVLTKPSRRRKARKKNKNRFMGRQKIQQGLKRKLEIGSSGSSLESTQPWREKRIKTLVNTNESEWSSSLSDTCDVDSGFSSEISPPTSGRSSPCIGVHCSMLLAIDCEMVGTGPNGQFSELARCSLLDYSGTVIYDKYVLPPRPVTDYRTQWSGIKKEHLINALPYEEARNEVRSSFIV